MEGRRRGAATPPIFEVAMLDAENWKIVFKVYAGHPISALTLAYQLIAIKQSLQRGRSGIPDAIAGLDLAIESLYTHTDFYKMGRKSITAQSKVRLNRSTKKDFASLA